MNTTRHTGWNQESFFRMEGAGDINMALSRLPTAESVKLYVKTEPRKVQPLENFQGIKVTTEDGEVTHVNCPTKRYRIVQHGKAFEPVLEGLKLSGTHNFKYVLYHNHSFASLQVYAGNAGYDGVSLGFSIRNSFDSTSAVKYGIKMESKTSTLELVCYRSVCANGVKIRVPMGEGDIIKPEIVTKIRELIKGQERILHTKSADEKIQRVQYVVEALNLLRKPVEAYIKKAQKFEIDDRQKLLALVKLHVGERYAERVMQRYNRDIDTEGRSLWALTQAITFVASHDPSMKVVSRENLIDKAADMMHYELFQKKEVTTK